MRRERHTQMQHARTDTNLFRLYYQWVCVVCASAIPHNLCAASLHHSTQCAWHQRIVFGTDGMFAWAKFHSHIPKTIYADYYLILWSLYDMLISQHFSANNRAEIPRTAQLHMNGFIAGVRPVFMLNRTRRNVVFSIDFLTSHMQVTHKQPLWGEGGIVYNRNTWICNFYSIVWK